jgi:maltokinase
MDAEVRPAGSGELTVQRVAERYPLEPGLWLTLTPEAARWRVAVQRDIPAPASAGQQVVGAAEPVYGADALAHLLRYQRVPPVERFNLVRHMPTPEASGERPVDDDGQVVVVGERVVVAWSRIVRDLPYTSPVSLAQLTAVDFLGVPDTHGLLIWTTPSGHEAPVAVVTRYLPRSVDGRQALISLLGRGLAHEARETPCLSSRMGRITAALHVALATRSSVLADPVRIATTAELTDWHERIRATIDRAALVAAEGSVPGAAEDFLPQLSRLEAAADGLLQAADDDPPVVLQRVHGDLHVGRILRWAGGLTITGFGDEPAADIASLGTQPAARDLARLLFSLQAVARHLDEHGADGRCAREWLPGARQRMLSAYRAELDVARRPELLDDRLIAAFEAEHAAREVIDAARQQASAESTGATETLRTIEAGRPPAWEQSRDPRW